MFKRFIKNMANRMAYARMVQVLNQLDDKQLADIGIARYQISEIARKAVCN
jgi:uncharacterized protein YjiS (DUF1127 family)